MNFTTEQLEALRSGQAVPLTVNGTECVVLRRDVYQRVQAVLDPSLPPETISEIIDSAMVEYDAGDPLLGSYQKYRP